MYLQRTYDKYGINSMSMGILEYLEKSDKISEKELKWINYFDSYHNGFNNTLNTNEYKPFKLTIEQINKAIQKSCKKVMAFNLNGSFYKEYSSVSEAARDVKTSSTNISQICLKRKNYIKGFIFIYKSDFDINKNYFYVKKKHIKTKEQRQAISDRLKGVKKENYIGSKSHEVLLKRCCIKIFKYDLSENLIESFVSIKDCCKKENLYCKTLKKSIENKTLLGGFLYKYN